jgi:3-oxoadipate CoA-transferase beta subunit
MPPERWTRDQLAARVARDLPDGAYVNLGIGLPTLIASHLPPEREIFLHSENGVLCMGPPPEPGAADPDLVNAGRRPITLLPGGAFFDQAQSFVMVRGGHLDIAVLGAYQVSVGGDLANWHSGDTDDLPAVGGAMDIAVGAERVFVMMEHCTRDGQSKLVEQCTAPLTAARCVHRIYTDLAVLDVTPAGLRVLEVVDGLKSDELRALSGVPLDLRDWELRHG